MSSTSDIPQDVLDEFEAELEDEARFYEQQLLAELLREESSR